MGAEEGGGKLHRQKGIIGEVRRRCNGWSKYKKRAGDNGMLEGDGCDGS